MISHWAEGLLLLRGALLKRFPGGFSLLRDHGRVSGLIASAKLGALIALLCLLAAPAFQEPASAVEPTIVVTAGARQTPHVSVVPHVDPDGNLRTAYAPGQSVFMNGIFWLSDEPKDAGVLPAPANAGFNAAITARNHGSSTGIRGTPAPPRTRPELGWRARPAP